MNDSVEIDISVITCNLTFGYVKRVGDGTYSSKTSFRVACPLEQCMYTGTCFLYAPIKMSSSDPLKSVGQNPKWPPW